MRIAVISDVHGNLPALEAVLVDVEREVVEAFDGMLEEQPEDPAWRAAAFAAAALDRSQRDLLASFAPVTEPTVVGGHVHFQFVQRAGAVQWVNAGSVGMPYEGAPGAYWLALGPEGPDHRRTEYDAEAAIAAFAATAYPDATDFAQSLLHPATREEVIAVFDPAE